MYRRILVAVENSPADETILSHVTALADLTDPDQALAFVRRFVTPAFPLPVH